MARDRLGDRQILGLTLGLDVAEDLHPLAARERLHEAWVEFLHELAAERPAVVLIEDLHWAEEPLLDLLERSSATSTGRCCSWAPRGPSCSTAPGLGRRPPNASLWLEPLSPEATGS